MRTSTLPLLLLVTACGSPSESGGRVIEDFRARSTALSCELVQMEDELAITELRATSDTSWAVLDEASLLIRGYSDAMRPLWTVELERDGPLGLPHPVGFSAAGDTLVYVVDRERFSLATLDTRDGSGHAMPLDFIPAGVTTLPAGPPVVAALPLGSQPRELLFVVEGDTLRPVDVPQRGYADMSINGLGNMILSESDATGSLLVIHQFMAPRAFRVAPDGSVRSLTPPVPDGTAHKREYIPVPPVTEEALPYVYVGASALATDRETGEVYLLAPSGRREGERTERAIMRLDASLDYRTSYLLDLEINAGHMAYLARRKAFLLGDDLDQLHLCDAPAAPDEDPSRVAILPPRNEWNHPLARAFHSF